MPQFQAIDTLLEVSDGIDTLTSGHFLIGAHLMPCQRNQEHLNPCLCCETGTYARLLYSIFGCNGVMVVFYQIGLLIPSGTFRFGEHSKTG